MKTRDCNFKNKQFKEINRQSQKILKEWLDSCTRRGKIARNTIAIGIVVLDHLQHSCPVLKEKVISQGGEISGARSGLGRILESYNIPKNYLKEVTTRQGHQDGQRLFKQLDWGSILTRLSEVEREKLLLKLIKDLQKYALEWINQQNLKFDIDRRQTPTTWINNIVENAKGRSGGVVE